MSLVGSGWCIDGRPDSALDHSEKGYFTRFFIVPGRLAVHSAAGETGNNLNLYVVPAGSDFTLSTKQRHHYRVSMITNPLAFSSHPRNIPWIR